MVLALMALAVLVTTAVADEVDDLILDLKYGSPDVREEAALALGQIGDEKAVDPLIKALDDEVSWVRMRAAIALGEINDSKAIDPLIKALKDESPYVRMYAASSLVYLGKTEYLSQVLTALKNENEDVRVEAAITLGEIGDTRAVDPLIEALRDESDFVRMFAASALGEIGDPSAFEPLTVALRDGYWQVREEAAIALGKIGDVRAIEPLTYRASNDANSNVRGAALEALEKLEADEETSSQVNDSNEISTTSDECEVPFSEILTDSNEEKIFTSDSPLQLAEGYELAIKEIDLSSDNVSLELYKNGDLVDKGVISAVWGLSTAEDRTYRYKIDFNGAEILIIEVGFKNAFPGNEKLLATVDRIWQISDTSAMQEALA